MLNENLPKDYDTLLQDYQAIKQDNEQLKQCVHEQKRQLNVLQALGREYEQEIEHLQQLENQDDKKWTGKVAQLEEELLAVKLASSEKIGKLEEEVLEKDCTISDLKKRVAQFEKTEIIQTSTEDCVKLLGEILDLKNHNEDLKSTNEDLQETIGELRVRIESLNENLSLRNRDIDELTETLESKRTDLNEAQKVIAELNDTLCQLRSELDALRSNDASHHNRGNSLFAEVDDRRVYLQKTIKDMKASYAVMKKERAVHLNEIARLKNENRVLCQQWKRDLDERHEDDEMMQKAFKDRISTLENLLKIYQSKPSGKEGAASDHFQLGRMIDRYKQQIKELEGNLSRYSLNSFCLKQEFAKINAEKRRWHIEALQSHMRLDMLRNKLKSMSEFDSCTDIWEVFDREMPIKEQLSPNVQNEPNFEENDLKDEDESLKEDEKSIIVEEKPPKSILKPSQENVIDLTAGDDDIVLKDDKDGKNEVICVYEDKVAQDGDEENQPPPSIMKTANKTQKNVNFAANTVEPKETNRSRLQRCKIIVPNVVIN